MTTFWFLLLTGAVYSFLLFLLAWLFARKINNYSLIDIVWTLGFIPLLLQFWYFGEGWLPRRILVLALVSAWSLRLGLFVLFRVYKKHPVEDERYKMLRDEYGANLNVRFFMFFQIQALSLVLLTIPFLLMSLNPEPRFNAVEIFGAVVWFVAVCGEALADHQMKNFKSDPANKGQVIQSGLWRYSRHPNYFFESCIWWGYYILALGTPGTWWTIYAPLFMLYILLKVTGVPMAEQQAIITRGDKYRDYQRRTSMFVPWWPKA